MTVARWPRGRHGSLTHRTLVRTVASCVVRLDQMRQTLRSAVTRRGREAVAWLAIGGTLVAMFLTAQQVRQGWAQRRLAAEQAVRDRLTTAAVLIGTEAARMSALDLRALLWPALATNASPGSRPLTLDEFAGAGARQFPAMHDARSAERTGYFRLARNGRDEWTSELRGALAADSVYALAVLDEVRRYTDHVDIDRRGARNVILYPSVRGLPFVVGMAPERRGNGSVVALFGVAYARPAALRTHVGHVLHGIALLPAPPGERNEDSLRSEWGEASGAGARVDNAALAVRLRYPNGFRHTVSRAADDDAVWRSGFVAARGVPGLDGGFVVEVAVPEHVGRRYVEAAMPLGGERLMLGGVLLLGLGFAAAAALGVRRQYKLAEARRIFVAAVSHELRTPLAHVTALSETLLLGRAESPEQAQRWLRAIHREGRRLSVLTENVLLHARGERRSIRAAPQWADLGAVVRDAASLVDAQAQARSARIVIGGSAVDGTGTAGGWVDADSVRQIVINLIENALKFGPTGQTVTITLDLERPAPDGVGGLLRLSVDDEGPGVSPSDRERIWQPFVRLAEGGSAPTGTGLGLSVVRQLVEELGGRWSVTTAPVGGARFSVELPLVAPAARVATHAGVPVSTPA
jgi:signal transduction histidine kinase